MWVTLQPGLLCPGVSVLIFHLADGRHEDLRLAGEGEGVGQCQRKVAPLGVGKLALPVNEKRYLHTFPKQLPG